MPLPTPPQFNKPRSIFLYVVIASLILASVFLVFNPQTEQSTKITLNQFSDYVKEDKVKKIEISSNKIDIELVDNSKAFTYKEPGGDIYTILAQAGIAQEKISKLNVEVVPTDGNDFWLNLIISIVPFLLIIGFFAFMMRQAQSSNNQAMSFGKSTARVVDKEKQKTTFADVAGMKESKEELVEVVDFLKNSGKYTSMGAKIPKGVLLIGHPGTGKTLLARAVAGEADVPFFNISGSEFVEMFVGVGASRVRDLFKKAKRNAPCIIFIDEIDAVGRHRGAGMGGGHDEREQTLNQILTEMDGFETGTNVIVMAATNRPDVLDPALLRPGRFDRRITVDMPNIEAREEILAVHARNKPLKKDVDLRKVAQRTPGMSGADLENLLNEAAILAASNNKKVISQHDIDYAIDKVSLGKQRKSSILSKEEKINTAYHEVGHALVGHILPGCDPIHKVSIIPQGMALGVTWSVPERDVYSMSRSKFLDQICMSLGGYVAEEVIFGEMTTGAASDLEKANNIARKMVTVYGMSDLGPIIFGEKNDEIFLGKDFGHVKNYSEEMAAKIDQKVKHFIDECYTKTREIVTKNKDLITQIAESLVKKETLSREEFEDFFKDGKYWSPTGKIPKKKVKSKAA